MDLQRAKTLFAEASDLQAGQRWGQAAAKYREAAAIKDTPGLRFRAGYCEAQRARLLEAKREFERAQVLLEGDPSGDDVRRLLPAAMARLSPRIPTLTVELSAVERSVVFELDSRRLPMSELGERLPLNPGAHSVRLRAPSGREFSRRVHLGEGEHRSLVARLGDPGGAPPSPPKEQGSNTGSDPAVERSAGRFTSPSVLAGTGLAAAGLAGGIAYLFRERQDQKRYQRRSRGLGASACRDPSVELRVQCDALHDAMADRTRARWRAGLGFATAGLGMTVALTSAWLGSGANIATSATITPQGAALTLEGSL